MSYARDLSLLLKVVLYLINLFDPVDNNTLLPWSRGDEICCTLSQTQYVSKQGLSIKYFHGMIWVRLKSTRFSTCNGPLTDRDQSKMGYNDGSKE
ncbi:hypothetical protein MJO28_013394 [Puccinia striiformis f. sp. tritici]|uniref:Uncharacterized protein n=1 Tax=Puccinia striiformis f. sp. tritici TaxID=168172 RepID=A0ACC0DYG5_9BASI|nr:hypothetical protein MJO28_013394 [Puccinia striiformis f. sp. tritici]